MKDPRCPNCGEPFKLRPNGEVIAYVEYGKSVMRCDACFDKPPSAAFGGPANTAAAPQSVKENATLTVTGQPNVTGHPTTVVAGEATTVPPFGDCTACGEAFLWGGARTLPSKDGCKCCDECDHKATDRT